MRVRRHTSGSCSASQRRRGTGRLLRDRRAGPLEHLGARPAAGGAPRPRRTERASFCWIDQRSGTPCSSSGMVQGTMPVTPTPATSCSLPSSSSRVVAQTLAHHSAVSSSAQPGMERVQLCWAAPPPPPRRARDRAAAPWSRWCRRRCRAGRSRDARSAHPAPGRGRERVDAVGGDLVPGVAVALEVGADDDAVGRLRGTRRRWRRWRRCWRRPAPRRASVSLTCASTAMSGSVAWRGPEMRMASARLGPHRRARHLGDAARAQRAGELGRDVHERGHVVGADATPLAQQRRRRRCSTGPCPIRRRRPARSG